MEAQGIRTASIMHLPRLAEKVRPPRMLTVEFPLGLTFGEPDNPAMHRKVMGQLLDLAVTGGLEEERPYQESSE